jgi:cysteinyl-tRNA synthetase
MKTQKLTLYNTLSRKKEEFKPINKQKVSLFVCGPTVYDFSHLGHARTYIMFDVIVKHLRHLGFKVFYLQNITDIDDKIIARARDNGVDPKELARQFEKEYLKDMKTLGVNSVNKYARASEYIPQIKSQIESLLKKQSAYETKDGSTFFDISSFPSYGKLSNQKTEELKDEGGHYHPDKKNQLDFALWKGPKPNEPWFPEGRPGWHIEDTAITETNFGPQYDIHGAGLDLIFPHHECEIAQMETISGKEPLAKYWMHTGFVEIKKEKMSNSLGNFITIRDFLKTNKPEVLRYITLSKHYRSPIEYNDKIIQHAENTLKKLYSFELSDDNDIRKRFQEKMNDDFNTPEALAVIFKHKKWIPEIENIFGISRKVKKEIPKEVKDLLKERQEARGQEDWKKSDELRKKIENLGFLVKDTDKGQKIT